jgi:hypothetical protein
LKGGVLLAALNACRPTRDIDFAAQAVNNDTNEVLRLVREVADFSLDDGIEFDVADAIAETIRDEDAHSGVRVALTGAPSRASRCSHQIGPHFEHASFSFREAEIMEQLCPPGLHAVDRALCEMRFFIYPSEASLARTLPT